MDIKRVAGGKGDVHEIGEEGALESRRHLVDMFHKDFAEVEFPT